MSPVHPGANSAAFSLQVFGPEAALLRLFGVQCCLLSLHPLDQMLDPIKDWLIRDPRCEQAVMLEFPV
jgi:hypothetical protein